MVDINFLSNSAYHPSPAYAGFLALFGAPRLYLNDHCKPQSAAGLLPLSHVLRPSRRRRRNPKTKATTRRIWNVVRSDILLRVRTALQCGRTRAKMNL